MPASYRTQEYVRYIQYERMQSTRGDCNNASYNEHSLANRKKDGEENEGWNKMGKEDRSAATG